MIEDESSTDNDYAEGEEDDTRLPDIDEGTLPEFLKEDEEK
jgi:hypothetical protein